MRIVFAVGIISFLSFAQATIAVGITDKNNCEQVVSPELGTIDQNVNYVKYIQPPYQCQSTCQGTGSELAAGGTDPITCKTLCSGKGKNVGTFRAKGWWGYCPTPGQFEELQKKEARTATPPIPEADAKFINPTVYCNQRYPCCCTNNSSQGAQVNTPPSSSALPTVNVAPIPSFETPPSGCDARGTLKEKIDCKLGVIDGGGVKKEISLNLSSKGISEFIGGIIKMLLGILGIIYLCMLLYAGFQWLTAQGDEKKIGGAIGIVNHAMIGLVIVVAAYSIAVYVLNGIQAAVK